MKKILITSGGTREYIDDVRILTNISTGKLGLTIAEEFSQMGDCEIFYVHAKDAVKPLNWGSMTHNIEVTDVESLKSVMENLVPNMDIVIHSMAVSDFGFEPCNVKLKSSDPEAFIESLRKRIKKNPKILPLIKKWNPKCILVGFKFEVGSSQEERKELAVSQIETSGCDFVITNDKKEIQEKATHVARMYFAKMDCDFMNLKFVELEGKKDIAKAIFKYVNKK
jgi:phosphopantothenate--cysteine ligase